MSALLLGCALLINPGHPPASIIQTEPMGNILILEPGKPAQVIIQQGGTSGDYGSRYSGQGRIGTGELIDRFQGERSSSQLR